MRLARAIRISALLTWLSLIPLYAAYYLFGWPMLTDRIAEWIMARTPSRYAVALLETMGPWAKPFAVTGALFVLGFLIFVAVLLIRARTTATAPTGRRRFITSAAMGLGVATVALESHLRDLALSHTAVEPVLLFDVHPPSEDFAPGLVRKAVTPIAEFYGMSKNTTDPAIDPANWQLRITIDGRLAKSYRYQQLLALPRIERYATLRCISNTLQSDLMGTAQWSGFPLSDLLDRASLPESIIEAAMIGVDGHGDSLGLDYVFSEEPMLALGMNGKTLDRVHGFPIRLLAPRYYGFKNVKWIGEIALLSKPYFGTWPKLGYTKEPAIHITSHIDRVQRHPDSLRIGGVSFAGTRGIRAVQVRANAGPWISATLDQPLSAYTWTRWYACLPTPTADHIEARAMDGAGNWQELTEGPLFPDGVTGPTIRRLS